MIAANEQENLNQLTAWTLSLGDPEFIHQHVVDAWAAQHADQKSKPIAVAFALIGLYLHLEKGYTGRQVQHVHMQLAQPRRRGPGRKDWPQFPLPRTRAKITCAEVMAAPDNERAASIESWCRSVWDSWRESQQQVREWAKVELSQNR